MNGSFASVNSSRGTGAAETATGGYSGIVGKSSGNVTLDKVINFAEIRSNGKEIRSNGNTSSEKGGKAGLVGEAVGKVSIINSQNKGTIRADGGLAVLVCKSSEAVEINNSANLGQLLGNEKTIVGESVTKLSINNFYMISDYEEVISKNDELSKTIKNFYWGTESNKTVPSISDVQFMGSEEMKADSFATKLNKNASAYLNELGDSDEVDISGWMGNRKEMNCYPMICPGESPEDVMYLETKRKNDEQARKLRSEGDLPKEHNLPDEDGTEGFNSEPLGDGSQSTPFIIDCTAAWNWVAEQSADGNSFEDKYISLSKNIGYTGNLQKIENFQGTLEGNGAVVKVVPGTQLFGTIKNATIKDLFIEDKEEYAANNYELDRLLEADETPRGKGTFEDPYIIDGADAWSWMCHQENNGVCCVLTRDLGFSESDDALERLDYSVASRITLLSDGCKLHRDACVDSYTTCICDVTFDGDYLVGTDAENDETAEDNDNFTSENPFGNHSGTKDDPYEINCTKAWNCMASSGGRYSGRFFRITKNIVGYNNSYISSPSYDVGAIIDGGGRVIKSSGDWWSYVLKTQKVNIVGSRTSSGSGTKEDPYIVNSADDWNGMHISRLPGTITYYKLGRDFGFSIQDVSNGLKTLSACSTGDVFYLDGGGFKVHEKYVNYKRYTGGYTFINYILDANIINDANITKVNNDDESAADNNNFDENNPFEGDGTEGNPYKINCSKAWSYLMDHANDYNDTENKYFKVTKNIGLCSDINCGGEDTKLMYGCGLKIDGNGKTIKLNGIQCFLVLNNIAFEDREVNINSVKDWNCIARLMMYAGSTGRSNYTLSENIVAKEGALKSLYFYSTGTCYLNGNGKSINADGIDDIVDSRTSLMKDVIIDETGSGEKTLDDESSTDNDNFSDSKPFEGDGTKDSPYQINCTKAWNYLMRYSSSYKNKHFKITRNIGFSSNNALETSSNLDEDYGIRIDGNGAIIKVNKSSSLLKAFLIVNDLHFFDTDDCIIGCAKGTNHLMNIENHKSLNDSSDSTSEAPKGVGLISKAEEVNNESSGGVLYLENCSNYGDVKGAGCVGGFVGIAEEKVCLDSCSNYGNINSVQKQSRIVDEQSNPSRNAGGMIGLADKDVEISGTCKNNGKIVANGSRAGGCIGACFATVKVNQNGAFRNSGMICADGKFLEADVGVCYRDTLPQDGLSNPNGCERISEQCYGNIGGRAGGFVGCIIEGSLISDGLIVNYGDVSANGGDISRGILIKNPDEGDSIDDSLGGEGGSAGGIVGEVKLADGNIAFNVSGSSFNYGNVSSDGGSCGDFAIYYQEGDNIFYTHSAVINWSQKLCNGMANLSNVVRGGGGKAGKSGALFGFVDGESGSIYIDNFVNGRNNKISAEGGKGGSFSLTTGKAEAKMEEQEFDKNEKGKTGQGGTVGVIGCADSNLNIINSHVAGSEFSAGENGLAGFLGDAGGTLNIKNSSLRGTLKCTGDKGKAGFIGIARNAFSLLSNNNYISCEINSERPGLLFGDTGENVSANLENTYVDCEDEQTEFANYKTGTKPNITGKGTNRGDIRTNAFLAQLNTNAKEIEGANGWLRLNSNDGYPITLCNQADPGSLLLDPSKPDAPEMEYKTDTSVVLKDGGSLNYSKDTNVWQKPTEFSQLDQDNEYSFYAKRVGWGQVEGDGEVSEGTKIRTLSTSVYEFLREEEGNLYQEKAKEELGRVEKEFYDEETGIYCMFMKGAYIDGCNFKAEKVDKDHANYDLILRDMNDPSKYKKAIYYSISFRDKEETDIEPNGAIALLIPIPEDFTEENLSALCVKTEEDDEIYENGKNVVTYNGKRYYMLVATHLSNWALVEKIIEDDEQPEEDEPAAEKEIPEPKEEGPADEKEIPEPKEEKPAEAKEEKTAEVKEIPEPRKEEPADVKIESVVEEEYEDEEEYEEDEDSTEEESKAVELALGDNASMVQITCAFLGLMLSTVLFNLKRKQQSR